VAPERALSELRAEDFRAVQGSSFRVAAAGAEPFEAQLAEVTEHGGSSEGAFRTPFAVIFHGPLEPVRPQGIYRIEHGQLGTLELFLVPIGPDGTAAGPAGMRYEAVFG
jgi:hypothetical protein